jgi:ferritin-like metal-binding protein YciE
VKSEGLAGVVAEHLEETRQHAKRLEQVSSAFDAEPSSSLDPVLERLAAHHDEVAPTLPDERLADVFHAASAAATEHHELARYEALLGMAGSLELGADARSLLERNRDEEARALARLRGELERLAAELQQLRA